MQEPYSIWPQWMPDGLQLVCGGFVVGLPFAVLLVLLNGPVRQWLLDGLRSRHYVAVVVLGFCGTAALGLAAFFTFLALVWQ
jgi:mannose/fructose/N-acetylgalactosamine-specific phosphotransferase system component IIC